VPGGGGDCVRVRGKEVVMEVKGRVRDEKGRQKIPNLTTITDYKEGVTSSNKKR